MKNNLSMLAKTFGIAAFCAAGLVACDNNLSSAINDVFPDRDADVAIGLMALTALQGTIKFEGPVVTSELITDEAPKELMSVTFDIFSRQLCHSNLTGEDRAVPVCNSETELSTDQRESIRNVLCLGTAVRSNKAYKKLFCGPVTLT